MSQSEKRQFLIWGITVVKISFHYLMSPTVNRFHFSFEWVLQQCCDASELNKLENNGLCVFYSLGDVSNPLPVTIPPLQSGKPPGGLFIALPNSLLVPMVAQRLLPDTVCHWSVYSPHRRGDRRHTHMQIHWEIRANRTHNMWPAHDRQGYTHTHKHTHKHTHTGQ